MDFISVKSNKIRWILFVGTIEEICFFAAETHKIFDTLFTAENI